MTRTISLWLFIVFVRLFSAGNRITTIFYKIQFYFSDQTGDLYKHLMSTYNKNVRPVRNNSDIVPVKLGLKLIQIADVVRIEYSVVTPSEDFNYFFRVKKIK